MINKTKLSSRFQKEPVVVKKVIENFKVLEPVITDKQYLSDVKSKLFKKIYSLPVWFDYSENEKRELIKSFLFKNNVNDEGFLESCYCDISGFGALNYLISQENVSAIYINGTKSIHIEIGGRVLNAEMKLSEDELIFLLKNLFYKAKIKSKNNIMNFSFDNFDVSIIMPEVAESGLNICIRKKVVFDYNEIIENEFVSKEIFDFIINAVAKHKNIVISGAANSGKTTFLTTLMNTSLKNNRVALLENFSKIDFTSDYLMKFNCGLKCDDDLFSQIKKMQPEYIVSDLNKPVAEFADNKGTITTIEAKSIEGVMVKLTNEFMVSDGLVEKYAKAKVLKSFDYIVHIGRKSEGKRGILSVVELTSAKTAALSMKIIAKYSDKDYVCEFN